MKINPTSLITLSTILLLSVSCASQNDVLTPAAKDGSVTMPAEAVESPNYRKLMQTLQSIKYEGVGLQFESEASMELLQRAFTDVRTHNRQITLIYTGLALSYDAAYKSLTVGGLKDSDSLIRYIEKNVPKAAPAAKSP